MMTDRGRKTHPPPDLRSTGGPPVASGQASRLSHAQGDLRMARLRALLLLVLLPLGASSADWPQWLGPNRDGRSTEKVKPWKGDLKVLWRVAVGPGHSSPVVAGGKVYLHTRVKDKEQEQLTAFDAQKGTELWSTPYDRAS